METPAIAQAGDTVRATSYAAFKWVMPPVKSVVRTEGEYP